MSYPPALSSAPTGAPQTNSKQDTGSSSSSSMDSTRAPPPAYSRVVGRLTRGKNLRPVVLLCIILGFIWFAIVAASNFKSLGDDLSGKILAAYIIQGTLFLVLCLLTVGAFITAYKATPKSSKACLIQTIIGGAVLLGAQICRIALHFAFKSDVKSRCVTVQQSENYPNTTYQDIVDWCDADWKNDIWRLIAWTVFVVACAIFMIVIVRSFHRQLLDPMFGRSQQLPQHYDASQAPSDRYRMGAMSNPFASNNNNNGYSQPEPLSAEPGSSFNMHNANAPDYSAAPPPMYVAPEKGSAYERAAAAVTDDKQASQRKDSMVDVRMGEADNDAPHDRDLAGQLESLNYSSRHSRSDSEDTIQGRQREGRI